MLLVCHLLVLCCHYRWYKCLVSHPLLFVCVMSFDCYIFSHTISSHVHKEYFGLSNSHKLYYDSGQTHNHLICFCNLIGRYIFNQLKP